MAHLSYTPNMHLGSDFIGHIGQYTLHFISGAPKVKTSYATLVRPFDTQVWIFLFVSIAAVSITLVFINKVYEMMSDDLTRETPFQSTKKYLILMLDKNQSL